MFRRKSKIEVVPESEYNFKEKVKDVALVGGTVGAASFATYVWTMPKPINAEAVKAISEPVNALADIPPNLAPDNLPTSTIDMMPVTSDVIQTGVIGDASLNLLATILDPLIQIMVAISFPIASVIMLGACFLFMLGNSEKAWSTIFNAGLGYILINLSPLFLQILKQAGKAVANG